MNQTVQDVMTTDVVECDATASLVDAAKLMRDRDIGDVLVSDRGELRGIVTDRDIVVRCVADGADPTSATLADVCSADLASIGSDTTVDDAAELMRERALRRLPVVDGGTTVGIVSIGDLAIRRDPDSALADINAARPNT